MILMNFVFVDRALNCTGLEHVFDQQQEEITKSFLVALLDIYGIKAWNAVTGAVFSVCDRSLT